MSNHLKMDFFNNDSVLNNNNNNNNHQKNLIGTSEAFSNSNLDQHQIIMQQSQSSSSQPQIFQAHSKLSSFSQSNIDLMFNDHPTGGMTFAGTAAGLIAAGQEYTHAESMRDGENRRRMLLSGNFLPKSDFQIEVNNPSCMSLLVPQEKHAIDDKKSYVISTIPAIQNSPATQGQSTPLRLHSFENSESNNTHVKRISPAKGSSNNSSNNNNNGNNKSASINPMLALKSSLMAKRFAQKLKLKANSQLFLKLTDHQFKIIGDFSSYLPYYRNKVVNILNQFTTYIFFFCRNLTLEKSWMPRELQDILWNIISFVFLISLILIIPVRFSFGPDLISFYDEIVAASIFYQAFNILIQFNQAVYKKGILIKNRLLIIKQYLTKTRFWIDLLILLLFLTSNSDSVENDYLKLSIILKFTQIMDMYDELQSMLEIKQKNKHYGVFLKIIFQILMIAHLAGCFFIKIGMNNKDLDVQNWITAQKISFDDYSNIYTSAIYWSVITMITVGYGDITPTNQQEKTYVIFVSLISCGIFGYSLNIIGQIIRSKEESKIMFQNKINDMNNFMKKRMVNRDMREKIFKYFHHLHKEEIKDGHDVGGMISSLPDPIRSKFLIDLYYRMIKSHPFFSNTFSDEFVLKMCSLVKEQKIGPEVNILDLNRKADKLTAEAESKEAISSMSRLYFIISGKVSFQTASQQEKTIKILEKGEIIGLQEFVTGQTSHLNPVLKSQSIVMLAFIEKTDFLSLLDTNLSEKEIFFMTKDKIVFNNDIGLCGQKCISCQNDSHRFQQCERLHLQPNKEKIIYGINSSKSQLRVKEYKRSNEKRNRFFYIDDLMNDSVMNEDFNKAKRDYVTQYTLRQSVPTMTLNPQTVQFQGSRGHSHLSNTNMSFQIRENSLIGGGGGGVRKSKRKQTNQSRAAGGGNNYEESADQRRHQQQQYLKVKEYKGQGSLTGNSAVEYDSVQNRNKRSHSELQFNQEIFGGSHQYIPNSPRNFTGNFQQGFSTAINSNSANTNNLSTMINNNNMGEYAHNNPISQREFNLAMQNDGYFNKEDYEMDRTSIILEKDEMNQSFSSAKRKRNVVKKQSKKVKGNSVFNMDDIRIKFPGGIIGGHQKNAQAVPSLTNIFPPEIPLAEDSELMNTFNQISSNLNLVGMLSGSKTIIPPPPQLIHGKISEIRNSNIQNNNNNNNINEGGILVESIHNSKMEKYYNDQGSEYLSDLDEDEIAQKNQLLFDNQLIAFKESKVMDFDSKKEFKIFFPEFNPDIIIAKLQKAPPQASAGQRDKFRGYRKVSKFKQTFNLPQFSAFKKK